MMGSGSAIHENERTGRDMYKREEYIKYITRGLARV